MSCSQLPVDGRCGSVERKGRRPLKPVHLLKRLCWSMALAVLLAAVAASVAAAAPVIRVSMLKPDYVTPGGNLAMWVNVINVGDQPFTGSMTIRYTLPAGVALVDPTQDPPSSPTPSCTQSGQVDECTIDVTGFPIGRTLTYATLTSVDSGATGVLSGQVDVSGGGASSAVSVPLAFNTDPIGPFAIDSFNVGLHDNPAVQPAQAGSVPTEIDTAAELRSQAKSNFGVPFPGFVVVSPPESMRDVIVHVPPGFVGYPPSTPARCTATELDEGDPTNGVSGAAQVPICPRDSQIGLALVNGKDTVPVYNLVPPLGAPAEFGFSYQGLIVNLRAKLRPSDNGIDIVTSMAPSAVPISKFEVQLWGVPSDSKYDPVRAACTDGLYGASMSGVLCPSSAVRSSFLRLPTSCGDPLVWGVDINSYQHPETFQHQETSTSALIGCRLNPFDPSLSLVTSTSAPHAASGVDTTLVMPQDPVNGVMPADIRTVTVRLPAGVAINPSSAGGLQACTDADLKIRQEGPATCDPASKIGTVSVSTPLLDHPIGGSVFLRTQNSSDPVSGEMFRLAIEMRSDDDGIAIRLPGRLSVDPGSGQLTATFDDLPQLPINSMDLHFKTGARAPLATPSACGLYRTEADFVGWNGGTAQNTSTFAVSGCGAPQFAPGLRAGVVNPVAGKSSPFNLKLTRSDSDQQFKTVTVYTPSGLLGRIKSAQQCSSSAAVTGACPAGSQIGSATVGAGVGSNPFYVTGGQVFLTGPYNGGPYGLAIVVHAVAGPFDLGTVTVRAVIHVNPRTAALSVTSDQFPTILKGVPLNIRDVRLSINKPNFMVNPTSCATKTIAATVTSLEGWNAGATSRFKVGECGNLRFTPRISMTVGSRGHTGIRHSTPLTTTITQPAGQANLREVKVSLPTTLDALLPVVNRACTLAQYNAGNCRRSQVGTAVAVTPLLKDPLRGGAFFVKHPGRPLPDLMVALRGAVSLDLVGKVTIPGGTHLATDFSAPDAPVTRFTLRIVSGRNGPIGVVTNLCTKKARNATVGIRMRGQNGASITANQRLHISGCGRRR